MTNEPSALSAHIARLKARVFALVRACPRGRVVTYGALAKAIGYPRGARVVGWIMNEASSGVPAQRVLNSKGELSGSWAFGSPDRMQLLLESEGILLDQEKRVDLKRYGWDPARDLSPGQCEELLRQADEAPEQPSLKLMRLMTSDPASPLKARNADLSQ